MNLFSEGDAHHRGRSMGRGVVCLCVLTVSSAMAYPDRGQPLPEVASPLIASGSTQGGFVGLRFTGDLGLLASLEDAFLLKGFTLGDGARVDLLLSPMRVMSEGATFVVGTSLGDVPESPPEVVLLFGQVLGRPESRAFLSLSEHAQYGYVVLDGVMHVLSSGPAGQGLPPVIYRTDEVPEGMFNWVDWSCLTGVGETVDVVTPVEDGSAGLAGTGRPPCRVAEIAVETDWEYTGIIFGGDTSASAAYALTLLGAVSEIYTRDVNTRLRVSFLRVWADNSDPYAGGGLGEFQNYWNANMGHVPRHAAHMLSWGYGGGVAYLPGLCNWWYEYGLSGALSGFFPYPLRDHSHYNWDPFVVSHELGHNFGAPHTHDHHPVIDGCGLGDCSDAFNGTIMSYCHGCPRGMFNIVLRLHERSVSEAILPWLNRARCDLTADPQCDIQCADVRSFRAVCRSSGKLTLKVRLRNEDHNGQGVVVSLNGHPFTFTVRGDRVVERVCCFSGSVTAALESPAGCVAPIQAPCP